MDFVHDYLADGRRLRTLNVVDAYTRECHGIEVDTSLAGGRVARVLDALTAQHGRPSGITVDNGPEFISQALDRWAFANGVALHFIQPGKPVQNAYVESFNGRFRDECLSQAHYPTLARARAEIELWRVDYNRVRPHSCSTIARRKRLARWPALMRTVRCRGLVPPCWVSSATRWLLSWTTTA
jgi:putative transposase